jgi:hypothetical protein
MAPVAAGVDSMAICMLALLVHGKASVLVTRVIAIAAPILTNASRFAYALRAAP